MRSEVSQTLLLRLAGSSALCMALVACQLSESAFLPAAQPKSSTVVTPLELGKRALQAKDFSTARRNFIASINQRGVTEEALTGIGLAEEGQGHLGEAERLFRMALAIAQTSVMAHNNLGVVLFRRKKYHEAQQAFQKAYALSSGSNEIAEHNLRLANLAVAEIDANASGAIEAHRLLRIGTSEYRLEPTAVQVPPTGQETEE